MAKKRITKEERQAQRQRKREGKKAQNNKMKQADESAAASMKAKKDAEKEQKKTQRRGQGSEIKKSAVTPPEAPVSQEPRVMNISVDPKTGEQTQTEYKNIADYTRANPTVVTPTISGNDPKTETIKQVSQNQKTFNPKEVEEAANNVGEAVSNVSKDVEKQDYALNIQEQEAARDEAVREEGEEPRAVAEGFDRGRAAREAAESGTGKYELTQSQLEEYGRKFRDGLAAAKASAPAAAIEQLGIEHYYPPQKDFITANFTGSYIGSRQLVAGTGALFPVGLLDARNRANEAKAKEKAERESKFWELSTTSPQYDERYKDVGMDILEKYHRLSGGNIDELMNGTSKLSLQFRRDMYDYQSRGAHLVEVMTNIKAITDKLNTGEGEKMYVPPHMYDQMMSMVEGTKDMDAFFRGEALGDKELRAISNYVRSYENYNTHSRNWITTIKDQPDKMPLRKDVDWSNPVNAANLQEAISRYGSNRDWNEYQLAMGKYFDMKRLDEIVTGIERENRVYTGEDDTEAKQLHQDRVRQMVASLGSEVDIERWNTSTNALGWENLRHKKDVWGTKKKWRQEDLESMYEGVNREMNQENFQNDIINAHNSSKDPVERSRAIQMIYQKYGKTVDVTGGYASMLLPTKGETVHSVDPKELQVIGRDGKQRNVSTELGNIRKDFYSKKEKDPNFKEGNSEYDLMLSQINELKQVTQMGRTPIPMNVGKRTITPSVYDAATSRLAPLDSWQGDIDPSMLTNTVHLGGSIGINTGEKDTNPKSPNYGKDIYRTSQFQFVTNHNIENDATRRALSAQEGKAEAIGWGKEYWYDAGEGGSYESSGASESKPQTQNEVYQYGPNQ
jgi:hypothetical protein